MTSRAEEWANELSALYAQEQGTHAPSRDDGWINPFPGQPTSYARYHLRRQHEHSEATDSEQEDWRHKLRVKPPKHDQAKFSYAQRVSDHNRHMHIHVTWAKAMDDALARTFFVTQEQIEALTAKLSMPRLNITLHTHEPTNTVDVGTPEELVPRYARAVLAFDLAEHDGS